MTSWAATAVSLPAVASAVHFFEPDEREKRHGQAAGGRATLRHGRAEQVLLEEVPVEKRARVLKVYLHLAPGARPHIPVNKDAPLEEFEAIAAQFPVFRVLAAG